MQTVKFIQATPELQQSQIKGILESLNALLQTQNQNTYLTRKQVSTMFDVSLATIHNWCKSGKLKPLGIGARVYFLRSDIEQSLTPLNS
jgi:predicted DNA-binding transcriptional regulator AlpA